MEHVESRTIQSMVMLKLYFQPGTDMAEATAQTVAYCNRALSFMPDGSLPPYVIRLDAGSVPVGYLVFESETRSVGQLQDLALYRVRPMFSGLAGISSPPPFGGNIRTIVVNVDPDRLRSYNLSPQDVVEALDRGNFISPSGNMTIKDQMTVVPTNAMVVDPQELRNIPLKLGENVYIRDVGTMADATDIPVGYALVNGRKSVYLPVVKQDTASTLTVVNAVKPNLSRFQAAVPDDVTITFEFDESPIVYRAIESVGVEGALGAGLTGLMILLFLRDLRSVIVVVLNIPLALLGSLFVLRLTGQHDQHHDPGRAGPGDRHPGRRGDRRDREHPRADGAHAVDVPRRAAGEHGDGGAAAAGAALHPLGVHPGVHHEGALRSLFVPLTLAVGFAMISSYLLSSTSCRSCASGCSRTATAPRPRRNGEAARPGLFERIQNRLRAAGVVDGRAPAAWSSWPTWSAPAPSWSSWERSSAASCSRGSTPASSCSASGRRRGRTIELTRQVAQKSLDVIAEEAGPENIEITMGYVGADPPQFTINMAYLLSRGPDDGMLRVGLREGSKIGSSSFQERLRKALPERSAPGSRRAAPARADRRAGATSGSTTWSSPSSPAT